MLSIMQAVCVQPIGILNGKTRVFSFFLRLFFIVISLSCCRYFLVMSLVGITSTYPSCYGLSVKHCFFFSKVLAINNTFFVCLYVSVCVCVCVCVFAFFCLVSRDVHYSFSPTQASLGELVFHPSPQEGGEGSGKTHSPKNACVGGYYSFSPTRKVCDRLIFMS